jgi:hypothetical protein
MGARKSTESATPFVDMRAVITLARRGNRLAGRLARDVQALVLKAPADLVGDVRRLERGVRTRADAAVREIEERGAVVVGAVERQLGRVSALVLRRFSAATQGEIDELDRRIATLEKRLRTLERRRRKARRPSA